MNGATRFDAECLPDGRWIVTFGLAKLARRQDEAAARSLAALLNGSPIMRERVLALPARCVVWEAAADVLRTVGRGGTMSPEDRQLYVLHTALGNL